VKRLLAAPSLVLAASLALTVAATQFAVHTTDATDRARFQNAVQATEDQITSRMNTYTAMLRATSGLFASRERMGEHVRRTEFHAYVDQLDLPRLYPGVQGIGFSQRVSHAEKDDFVAAVRATGIPEFHLWPEHERGEYHPALYLEPLDHESRAALGYDMYSAPERRQAMERARDTAAPTLSSMVMRVQEIDRQHEPGFLLYVPVYRNGEIPDTVERRRALLRGFAYSPFRARDLFKGIFETEPQPRVVFEVYDGDAIEPQRAMYDSRTVADRARVPPFSVTRKLEIAGRRWTVLMNPTASFERGAHGPAIPFTAAAGVVLSLAFFVATRAQSSARMAAERAADQIRRSLAKRERAEEALRQSSRRVQVIIDALPALVSFVDTEERYRFASRAYQEWFGISSRDAVGKTLSEVLGERAMTELQPYVDRVMAGEYVTFEAVIPFNTGERIVHANYSPHFSESGKVEGFIALVTDITQQKRSEDWQRFLANATGVLASSMDYATTLQSVAQLSVPRIADYCVVYMADAEGALRRLAVAHVDPAKLELLAELERQFAMDRNAPLGPVQVLRTGVSELAPILSDTATEASAADPEYRAMARALNVRSAMTVPLRIRDEIMGVITFAITESGRAYTNEDVQRAEDLARRAAAAIENARLYSAAQEAIRVRDEFLSIASHELKTPLTPLQLQLDSLSAVLRSSELESDKLNRKLETANRQTRRLTKLVENLLDVSRISGGRLSLEREHFDLSEATTEVVERFGADAGAAGCRITVHADEPVVGLWDRLRLEQVLSNLLSNAIKYGAGKPIDVRVRQDGATARLTIEDQGIGIAPEDSSRIFGRFERAVPIRHYGGMGLGLYIARQIVDAHGGSIVVTSAPGRGSTFTVVLPLGATEIARPPLPGFLGSKTLQ
jgi:PAS domain S-box-containing protein